MTRRIREVYATLLGTRTLRVPAREARSNSSHQAASRFTDDPLRLIR